MYGIALQKNWESIQAIVLPGNSYPDIPPAIQYGYALRIYFLCLRFKDELCDKVNWEVVEKLPGAAQAMIEAQVFWEIADTIGPDGTVWWKKILEDSRTVVAKFCKRLRYHAMKEETTIGAERIYSKKHTTLDVYFQTLTDLAIVARASLERKESVVYPDEVEVITSMAKTLPLIYAEYIVNSNFASTQFRITRDKAYRYVLKIINEIWRCVQDHFEERPEVLRLFSSDYRRKHRLKKVR